MVPIIKNKTGDTSDKNNYRPIALVTAASKLFESCILEILETYLLAHDYKFGFKAKHSTDMCIFTVKTLIKYYTDQKPLFLHVYLVQVRLSIRLMTGHYLQS